jgi:2-polyprenyl-6-hydroxyphenyl methylase/3-demethylubiquinone-9 3-methyltransferase
MNHHETINMKIEMAIVEVKKAVRESGREMDVSYFYEHAPRYKRTMRRLTELQPVGASILNIGSHYLHLSAALRLLGYEVIGIDVAAFSNDPLVRHRASEFHLANHVVNQIDLGEFLEGAENTIDLVLFTEILEHVTFNPIRFWRRVYELMKIGGIIYITTPNSLTPWDILHSLKDIAMLRGTGLSVEGIFGQATYGHHWKEYSGRELRNYFARLSPDFLVQINYFDRHGAECSRLLSSSIKTSVRHLVHRLNSFVPPFRNHLEAVVRLTSKNCWLVAPPKFI